MILVAVVLGMVAALAALVVITRPTRFRVVRSITIRAPSAHIVGLLDDLRRWPAWSEQGEGDPSTKRQFSGAERGAGAECEFEGEGQRGKGRMRIVEASPSVVRVQVDWKRPFVASNANIFRIEPRPDGDARVTWTLDGENVLILKAMSLFVGAERLMGSHLEQGLAKLKRVAEELGR